MTYWNIVLKLGNLIYIAIALITSFLIVYLYYVSLFIYNHDHFNYIKLRYKTTAKAVYDQPYSTSDQKDRDQSKLIRM